MPGQLLALDGYGTRNLHDRDALRSLVYEAVHAAGMTPLGEVSVRLDNGYDSGPGVSIAVLIAESHLAVHTWPESGMVYFEFSSCQAFDATRVKALCAHWLGVERWEHDYVLERG